MRSTLPTIPRDGPSRRCARARSIALEKSLPLISCAVAGCQAATRQCSSWTTTATSPKPAPIHDRLSLTAAPTSRASGRGGGYILRAPGGPVDLDRHPAGSGPRFDQFERPVPAGVREQPRALADDHGIGEQGDLVDKLFVEQPPDQGAAAMHLQLAFRLGFQLADGRGDVTGEDGRIRPARFGERGRCHVLGLRIQSLPDRAVTGIWPHSPGAGKDLIGPPAQQEGVGALEDPIEERRGLVDEQRWGPSASLESAPAILTRAAETLHHSIDGDVRDGRQFHGRGSLLAEFVGGWLVDVATTALLLDLALDGFFGEDGIDLADRLALSLFRAHGQDLLHGLDAGEHALDRHARASLGDLLDVDADGAYRHVRVGRAVLVGTAAAQDNATGRLDLEDVPVAVRLVARGTGHVVLDATARR